MVSSSLLQVTVTRQVRFLRQALGAMGVQRREHSAKALWGVILGYKDERVFHWQIQGKQRGRERETVCVCVCERERETVCVYEREREREREREES